VRFVVVVVVVEIGGVEEFVASVVVVVVVQEELVAGVKGKTEEIFVRLFFFGFNGSRNCWWSFS